MGVVGRAALILKQFHAGERQLGPAALARRTGLPKATVHRMLHEMARVGLLERHGHGFRPGVLLFELGQLVPHQHDLLEVARRHMAVLHDSTGHNVGLAILQDGEVIHIDLLRSRALPRVPQRTGGRWPAHASCSGKVLLAFGPPTQAEAVLATPLRGFTAATITGAAAFAAELKKVRRAGVAFDRREAFPNVAGVAAPVLSSDGEILAALSMSDLPARIVLSRVDALVRAGALAISRDLVAAQSIVLPVLARRIATRLTPPGSGQRADRGQPRPM